MIQFEQLELLTFLKRKNFLWFNERFKVSKILDTKPVTYRLRDTKDKDILGGFYDYEFHKSKIIIKI